MIPSMQDWFRHIQIQPWMMKVGKKNPHAETTDTQDANRIRPTDRLAVPAESGAADLALLPGACV
jgi:hypothetical protein